MKLNDFVVEFLEEVIPYYASNSEWRNIFQGLVDLSEEERTGMLQRLNMITDPQLLGLESDEQFPMALDFLRLNLEEPLNPRMIVKMIDWENLRAKKNTCDEGLQKIV